MICNSHYSFTFLHSSLYIVLLPERYQLHRKVILGATGVNGLRGPEQPAMFAGNYGEVGEDVSSVLNDTQLSEHEVTNKTKLVSN